MQTGLFHGKTYENPVESGWFRGSPIFWMGYFMENLMKMDDLGPLILI
jgi:hypothetical protein